VYDNGEVINTGEWIRDYTYARLRNAEISLWRHNPERADEKIDPINQELPTKLQRTLFTKRLL
jgi:hypothetical protein